MVLTLKVYYEKPNGNKEIRRFPLNIAPDGDMFNMAFEKIKQLYPDLRAGDFQLFWEDSDGDRIVFSCTEEMQEAVRQVKDEVLRIYVSGPSTPQPSKPDANTTKPDTSSKTQSGPQKDQPKPQGANSGDYRDGPFHRGVVCDGCEGPVYGIRYKCCTCDDYDLCEACEAKGMHKEHNMYKIPEPRFNPMNFMPPHLGRQFHRFMRGQSREGASSSTSDETPCGGGRNKAQFDQYLNDVGANIAAFLDPFGIDMTYDVHSGDGGCSQRGWGGRRRGGKCGGWRRRCGRTEETTKGSGAEETNTEQKPGEEQKDQQKTEDKQTSDTQSHMETDETEKETPKESSPGEEWTFVPEAGAEVPVGQSQAIPMPGPAPMAAKDSAPIPMPGPAPDSAPMTTPPSRDVASASNMTSGPSTSTSVDGKTGLYPDLRIQQSLDQMLAMGFTNTDGWLGDLLTEHRGDIGLTLDAIKAKATQQLENLRGTR